MEKMDLHLKQTERENVELMPNEEAQEMANMMRGWLSHYSFSRGSKIEAEQIKASGFSASRESYERAYEVVRELQQLVEDEGQFNANLYKIARSIHNLAKIPAFAMYATDLALMTFVSNFDTTPEKGKNPRQEIRGFLTDTFSELNKMIREGLTDPAKKLGIIDKMGKKFEKAETKHFKIDGSKEQNELKEKLKRKKVTYEFKSKLAE